MVHAARTASAADAAYLKDLAGYEAQCEEVLAQEAETAAAPSPGSGGGLFEGQLSAEGATQPPADPLMDYTARLFAHHLPPQPADGGSAASPAAAAAPRELSEAEAEALQRQLDAIAVQLMEETGREAPRAAPPASKAAVRRLPRERVDAARWRELGGEEARCPVCFCLEVGDEIMTLPCKHWSHPECMAPWLEERNSCPTCRHELPTDDNAYERRKAREATEVEDRRGAANALTHNEFLYI